MPVNSMSRGTLPYFIGFKINALVKSNGIQNTMTVNKIFHNSKDVDFNRNIMGREKKSIFSMSTPMKTKCLPLHDETSPI